MVWTTTDLEKKKEFHYVLCPFMLTSRFSINFLTKLNRWVVCKTGCTGCSESVNIDIYIRYVVASHQRVVNSNVLSFFGR
jgi:hypothetical protein